MFKNTFQSGFLSILYSIGSKPLQIWDKEGECRRESLGIRDKAHHVLSTGPTGFVWVITYAYCCCADVAVHNGHIKRITDEEIQSSVLEIMSSNVSTTFITCPADPQKTLGIKLPFLVMIVKVSTLGPSTDTNYPISRACRTATPTTIASTITDK
jgi:hypothetical protein